MNLAYMCDSWSTQILQCYMEFSCASLHSIGTALCFLAYNCSKISQSPFHQVIIWFLESKWDKQVNLVPTKRIYRQALIYFPSPKSL